MSGAVTVITSPKPKQRRNRRRNRRPQVKQEKIIINETHCEKAVKPKRERRKPKKRDYSLLDLNKMAMEKRMMSKVDNPNLNTIKMWLEPDKYICRLPDCLSEATCLIRSVRTIPLYVNFDNSAYSGYFSVLIQPKIGSLDQKSNYQVAMVDTSAGWEPSNYKYISYVSGSDIRLDPNISVLSYPSLGIFKNSSESAVPTSAYSFGAQLPPAGINNLGMPCLSQSVQYTGYPLSDWFKSILTPFVTYPTVSDTFYVLTLAAGSYQFNCQLLSEGTLQSDPTCGVYFGLVVNGSTYYYSNSSYLFQGMSYANSSTNQYNFNGSYETYIESFTNLTGRVHNASNFELAGVSAVLNVPDDGNSYGLVVLGFASTVMPATAPSNGKFKMVTTLSPCLSDSFTPTNSGNITQVRPVGLSCLLTNTQPNLYAGGFIVAGQYSAATVMSYFNNNNLQDFNNLYNKFPQLSYKGSFTNGAYAWWCPTQINQFQMKTVQDSNNFAFDPLIFCGQVTQVQGGPTGYCQVGELVISQDKEAIPSSTIWETKVKRGLTTELEKDINALADAPHACENPLHLKQIFQTYWKSAKIVQSGLRRAAPYIIKGMNAAVQYL